MRDAFGELRVFRLHSAGLQCDSSGLSLDGLALLRRETRASAGTRWSPRPLEEMELAYPGVLARPFLWLRNGPGST